MPKKTIPAVSIIIPMYNAEKYIGECLESILAQTFQDYEVIVVDDCSTDKSCEVVESYLSIFGDKLRLIRSKKNFGGPAVPRNIGINSSCGEYLMFVDNDDAITPTALEELYPIAKNFDADVVYCEKYYPVDFDRKFTTDKYFLNAAVRGDIKYNLVKIPTLNSNEIENRLEDFLSLRFWVAPWNYFIRRDFIIANEIYFPELKYGDDNFFVLLLVCFAKNIVRVPNTIYVYRNRQDSLSHNASIEKNVQRYTDHFFQGVSLVNKFADKFPFLNENPEFKYRLFEFYSQINFGSMATLYGKVPLWMLDSLLRKELDKVNDKTALTAFLCNRINILDLQLIKSNATIQQQRN